MPKIHLTTPDGTAHDFELTSQRARIGRAEDNDIVVPDGSVSSYHGEITLTGDGIQIQDRGSTNGTFFGGQRVEQADIPWGGGFRIGSCECVLVADAPEEAAGHEEPEAHEESSPTGEADASFDPGHGAAVITGLGATPCPSAMRRGFGPKVKSKDSSGSMIMLLAVVALLACAAAGFMIMKLGA